MMKNKEIRYTIYEYSDYYGCFECLTDISKEEAIKLREKLLEDFDEKLPGFFYRKDMVFDRYGDFETCENGPYLIECDELSNGKYEYNGYLLVLCPDTEYNIEVMDNANYSGMHDIDFVKAFVNTLEMEEIDGKVAV